MVDLINNINSLDTVLSSLSKNSTDTTGVDDFLETYTNEKMNETTNLGYNTLSEKLFHIPTENNNEYLNIFRDLTLKLECDEDSVKSAATMIINNCPVLDSYKNFNEIGTLQFSVLDVLSGIHILPVQKIKQLLEPVYPLILINIYKYQMMADFYSAMRIEQESYDIIYKIIILTLTSVIDDIESCDIITKSDFNVLLENLKMPPTIEFCKKWMKMHELACIFESRVDASCILYNYKDFKDNIYIHFEFYSKMLTVLKSAKLTVRE